MERVKRETVWPRERNRGAAPAGRGSDAGIQQRPKKLHAASRPAGPLLPDQGRPHQPLQPGVHEGEKLLRGFDGTMSDVYSCAKQFFARGPLFGKECALCVKLRAPWL